MQTAFQKQTERLLLREFCDADAPFIVRLLNEPSFIENIADRGVRTETQARAYLQAGPMASYVQHGFGLWAVQDAQTGTLMGMCGLIKRANLPEVDLGYALLPEFAGHGFAFEACQASMQAARDFGLPRLLAIVNPDNGRSRQLLARLGFAFSHLQVLDETSPALCVYQYELKENTEC
jgi:RimJ/RimL family protein N-acetyltransferase